MLPRSQPTMRRLFSGPANLEGACNWGAGGGKLLPYDRCGPHSPVGGTVPSERHRLGTVTDCQTLSQADG